jgi:hypothetical protein
MGERGQITRLLAAKYGGHLTFAALSADRASAPGQPTIQQLQVCVCVCVRVCVRVLVCVLGGGVAGCTALLYAVGSGGGLVTGGRGSGGPGLKTRRQWALLHRRGNPLAVAPLAHGQLAPCTRACSQPRALLPSAASLQGLYRFRKQGPGSKLFGIIGNPVHHSKSPLIHNSAFEHIGAPRRGGPNATGRPRLRRPSAQQAPGPAALVRCGSGPPASLHHICVHTARFDGRTALDTHQMTAASLPPHIRFVIISNQLQGLTACMSPC